MNETILAILFLIVSTVSTAIQSVSLWRLCRWHYADTPQQRHIHYGMVRTAGCRVLAAAIYVGVGVTTLLAQQALPVLALVVFSFVQMLWQANALADVRLRRDLADADRVTPQDS